MAKQSPYEKLLDKSNNENIIFSDSNGNLMEFEQVAVLSLNDEIFAILHPINMGYDKDEVIVYNVFFENNQYELLEVEDEILLEQVNEEYQRMYLQNK